MRALQSTMSNNMAITTPGFAKRPHQNELQRQLRIPFYALFCQGTAVEVSFV